MGALIIAVTDGPLPVTGRCTFPALLPLPVDAAQMDGGFTIAFSLDLKALVADLDVQSVSLVSAILYLCPLLPPNIDVLPFIVLPVLPLTEAILSNRPGGDDNVDMGVIL